MVENEPTTKDLIVRPDIPVAVGRPGPIVDNAEDVGATPNSSAYNRPRRLKLVIPNAVDCIIVFNGGVALFASLWLACSGKWLALGCELSDVIVAPFLFVFFALAMTPAMAMVSLRAQAVSDGRGLIAYFCRSGIYVWTALVQLCWCVFCFHTLPLNFEVGLPWPDLLFAYSLAALPFQWLLKGPWEGEVSLWSRLLRRLIRARVQFLSL